MAGGLPRGLPQQPTRRPGSLSALRSLRWAHDRTRHADDRRVEDDHQHADAEDVERQPMPPLRRRDLKNAGLLHPLPTFLRAEPTKPRRADPGRCWLGPDHESSSSHSSKLGPASLASRPVSKPSVANSSRRECPRREVGGNPVHVITLYLRCVTPGASTARTCSSSISAPPRLSKRRAPSPSSTGTMWSSSSSRSPAARYC